MHDTKIILYLCIVRLRKCDESMIIISYKFTTRTKLINNPKIMNTENTKAQMRKGILEFCILSLIDQREMYVSDLIDELKKGKLDVVEGTLYPLLTRLKNGEFLSYRWEESTGGPPRKYYQITEKGNLFLAELRNTWNELTDSVNQITKNTNPTSAPESAFQPNS